MQSTESGVGSMVRSPSIIWDGTKYRMWFTNGNAVADEPRVLTYAESVDGKKWTNRQFCKINEDKRNC